MFSSFFRQKTYDAADVMGIMDIINRGLTDLQLQLQLQSTRLDEVSFFIAPYLLVEKHFYTPDPNNLFFELNKYIHRVFERENYDYTRKQKLLVFNKYCIEAISIAFNNAMEKNRKKIQYKDNNPPLGFYLFMLVFTFTLLQYEINFNTPNTTLRMINNSTIINFNDMLLELLTTTMSSKSQLTIEILLNTLKMAADPTAADPTAAEAAAAEAAAAAAEAAATEAAAAAAEAAAAEAAAAVVVDPAAAAAAAEAEAAREREIKAAKKKIEEMADEINAKHAEIVFTRINESTIPNSTRYALDQLRAAQAAAKAAKAAKAANAPVKKGGNKRKSKKSNSRKKKRVPITRRRRVKSIKYKKNVV